MEVDNAEASPTRGGGGLAEPCVQTCRSCSPLRPPSPSASSPSRLGRPMSMLADAGGGAGAWDVASRRRYAAPARAVTVPPTVTVPGALQLRGSRRSSGEGRRSRRVHPADAGRRQAPRPVLAPGHSAGPRAAPVRLPSKCPGLHVGDTRGRPALVSRYRYPDVPTGGAVTATSRARAGLSVRRDEAGRELRGRRSRDGTRASASSQSRRSRRREPPHRLRRAPAQSQPLPDPVRRARCSPQVPSGRWRAPTTSFSTAPRQPGPGSFAFRFWVDDTRPPTATLDNARSRGSPLVIRVTDAGSGVDPSTVKVSVDGRVRRPCSWPARSASQRAAINRGTHRLRVQISDYQESRNMENVPPILPNTRVLTRRSTSASRMTSARRLALLDRRQRLEVGLNAADELVIVRRDHAKVRLPLLSIALSSRVRAGEALESRPFGGDDDSDRDRKQDDPGPTHSRIVPRGILLRRSRPRIPQSPTGRPTGPFSPQPEPPSQISIARSARGTPPSAVTSQVSCM